MLTISPEQMDALDAVQQRRFTERLAAHLLSHYPDRLTDEKAAALARACIEIAAARDLHSERDIAIYSHLLIAFGRDFETRSDIARHEPIARRAGETPSAWVQRVARIGLQTQERGRHA